MPILKPSAIVIFAEYSAALNKARKELKSQDWFRDDWWINLNFGSNGFTFQLSKTHWFNHTGQGIHFEFWIEEQEHRAKIIPIVLHFEPDTPNREKLGIKFKKSLAPFEKDFDDFRINHKAICDKLQKQEKFSKSGLANLVVVQFSRLKDIAPVIDEILLT
jgi:hypothetical protein